MQQKLKIAVLLTLAFVANSTAAFGQNIYEKRSGLDIYNIRYNSVFTSDTGFLVTGWDVPVLYTDTGNFIGRPEILFSWHNWSGDTIKKNRYGDYNRNYEGAWFNNHHLSNNIIYHFATYSDTANVIQGNYLDIRAIKFNINGDTIWSKKYDSGQDDYGYGSVDDGHGGLIGVGSSAVGNNHCSRIMRYDSLGNILWNRLYGCENQNSLFYIIKGEPGYYYVSGYRRPSMGNSNPKNARCIIFKIDSLGNVVWSKTIPGVCDETMSPISLGPDGNLFLAKEKCNEQPTLVAKYSNISLYKINHTNGAIIWNKVYPTQITHSSDYPNFVEVLSDNDILIGGTGLNVYYGDLDTIGHHTGELIKTDSSGNLLWQRYYLRAGISLYDYYQNYIYSGKEIPGGGFILVGETNSSQYSDGWIIKTDANGCIDAGCVNGIEELKDDDYRLFIYPNPAEEYVSIDLPILYKKGTLQVYTMQGQLVKSASITTGGTQNFNISDMPNGIYQLVVYSATNKLLGRQKLLVAR